MTATAVALAFAATSATAQSPPAGDVLFRGGFETGKISEWGGQCANTGTATTAAIARGTAGLTVRVVGQGKFAARFNLPAAATNNACEFLNTRSIGLGTDDYYGLMVLFPKKWREPSPAGWGLSIAQLSFQGIWGAPVSLNAHARNIALELQSGLCAPYASSHPGCTYSSGSGGNVPPMIAVPAPLALGVWHEIVVHVRHTTDSHRGRRGLAPSQGAEDMAEDCLTPWLSDGSVDPRKALDPQLQQHCRQDWRLSGRRRFPPHDLARRFRQGCLVRRSSRGSSLTQTTIPFPAQLPLAARLTSGCRPLGKALAILFSRVNGCRGALGTAKLCTFSQRRDAKARTLFL